MQNFIKESHKLKIKKGLLIVMISLLMFTSPSFNVLAEQLNEGEEVTEGSYSAKDEVIYGNLDATGKVNDIYLSLILTKVVAFSLKRMRKSFITKAN